MLDLIPNCYTYRVLNFVHSSLPVSLEIFFWKDEDIFLVKLISINYWEREYFKLA